MSINKTSAIIVAAGKSTRMNGLDKLIATINGIPVIAKTAMAFEENQLISEIIIVTSDENRDVFADICKQYKISKLKSIVLGGETRHESIMNGIAEISGNFVAIHDGARPLISQELITNVIKMAFITGASLLGVRSKDTVKISANGQKVDCTPDRNQLFNAQTPQVFNAKMYLQCVKNLGEQARFVTDDSMIFELCGISPAIVEGDYRNIKITTPEDLTIAEIFNKT